MRLSRASLKSEGPITKSKEHNDSELADSPYASSKMTKSPAQSEYKIRDTSKERRLPPRYKEKRDQKRSVEPNEYISVLSGISQNNLARASIKREDPLTDRTTSALDDEFQNTQKISRRLYESSIDSITKDEPKIEKLDPNLAKTNPDLRQSYFSSARNPRFDSEKGTRSRMMKRNAAPPAIKSSPNRRMTAYERSKMRHGLLTKPKNERSPTKSITIKKPLKKEDDISPNSNTSQVTMSKIKSSPKGVDPSPLPPWPRNSPLKTKTKSPYSSKIDKKRYEDQYMSFNQTEYLPKNTDRSSQSRVSMMYKQEAPKKLDKRSPEIASPRSSITQSKERTLVDYAKKAIERAQPSAPNSSPKTRSSPKKQKQVVIPEQKNSKNLEEIEKKVLNIFTEIIRDKENLEFARQELALKPDFNLKDLFNCFDESNQDALSLSEFSRIVRKLGLKESRNSTAVTVVFENFDKDQDSLVNFEEFGNIFMPNQNEYKILMNCRVQKDVQKGSNFERVSQKPLI